MSSQVVGSALIRKNFNLKIINLQFSKTIAGLESFSIIKVYKAAYYGIKILWNLMLHRPDLIYFTMALKGYASYRDIFYLFLMKLFRIKIVLHLHGKGIERKIQDSPIKKIFYRWVFKNTFIISLSKGLSHDLVNVYQSKPFIVPNGIQYNRIINPSNRTLQKALPKILYLSNLIQNKGILVLIEALNILKIQGKRFSARLVGAQGDLTYETVNQILKTKDLSDEVTIVGPMYGENKITEFQNADLFIFPTYNDAFPLVILEAMQHSLPIISTYEGGIPEIVIDGLTGYLVEQRNANKLAEKTSILLKENKLRLEMGKRGFERFTKYFTLNQFEVNLNKTFMTILGIN